MRIHALLLVIACISFVNGSITGCLKPNEAASHTYTTETILDPNFASVYFEIDVNATITLTIEKVDSDVGVHRNVSGVFAYEYSPDYTNDWTRNNLNGTYSVSIDNFVSNSDICYKLILQTKLYEAVSITSNPVVITGNLLKGAYYYVDVPASDIPQHMTIANTNTSDLLVNKFSPPINSKDAYFIPIPSLSPFPATICTTHTSGRWYFKLTSNWVNATYNLTLEFTHATNAILPYNVVQNITSDKVTWYDACMPVYPYFNTSRFYPPVRVLYSQCTQPRDATTTLGISYRIGSTSESHSQYSPRDTLDVSFDTTKPWVLVTVSLLPPVVNKTSVQVEGELVLTHSDYYMPDITVSASQKGPGAALLEWFTVSGYDYAVQAYELKTDKSKEEVFANDVVSWSKCGIIRAGFAPVQKTSDTTADLVLEKGKFSYYAVVGEKDFKDWITNVTFTASEVAPVGFIEDKEDDSGPKLPVLAIVGIVVGGAVAISLILGFIVYRIKRRSYAPIH